MRNLIGTVAALIAVSGVAGAQEGFFNDYYKMSLEGCTRQTTTGITTCVVSGTRMQFSGSRDNWYASRFAITESDGTVFRGSSIALPRKEFAASTGEFFPSTNITYRFTVNFRGVKGTTLPRLEIFSTSQNASSHWENVPVKLVTGSAAASPAPVASLNLGTTQAVLGGKAYTVSLTNCMLANGSYTCIAKATPSR